MQAYCGCCACSLSFARIRIIVSSYITSIVSGCGILGVGVTIDIVHHLKTCRSVRIFSIAMKYYVLGLGLMSLS